MFDLTWFCSHMFSASGEHPLLPFLSLLTLERWGSGGCQQQCRVWAHPLGGKLAASCTDWVQYLPQVYESVPLLQPGLFSFSWLGLNLTSPSREVWGRGHFLMAGRNLALAKMVPGELAMLFSSAQVQATFPPTLSCLCFLGHWLRMSPSDTELKFRKKMGNFSRNGVPPKQNDTFSFPLLRPEAHGSPCEADSVPGAAGEAQLQRGGDGGA